MSGNPGKRSYDGRDHREACRLCDGRDLRRPVGRNCYRNQAEIEGRFQDLFSTYGDAGRAKSVIDLINELDTAEDIKKVLTAFE